MIRRKKSQGASRAMDVSLVRANVVDIRNVAMLPKHVAVDANVLYFAHYPNFASLAASGGKSPFPYQLQEYPNWYSRAVKAGKQFFTSAEMIGEFIKLIEFVELEMLWLSDGTRTDAFTPLKVKEFRYEKFSLLPDIRRQVITILHSLRKTVNVIPAEHPPERYVDAICELWMKSVSDHNDSALVRSASRVGCSNILTDDLDHITFEGITVYTANKRAIEFARAARKLL